MKKFLFTTLVFSCLSVFCIIFLYIGINWATDKTASFESVGSPTYIVLGHSHPACAFNDSLIDNFKNFSESGESYFYTYIKIKKLLEQRPSIQTVFVEFDNYQIKNHMNDWIWTDEHLAYRMSRYSPFMDINESNLIMAKNPKGFLTYSSLSTKKNLFNLFYGYRNYSNKIGGYEQIDRILNDSVINMQLNDSTITNDIDSLSWYSIDYLDKILQFCNSMKKNVFLIRCPMHPESNGIKNESTFQNLLSERFTNTEFLDFYKYPVPNNGYGDLEHLNYYGACNFSIWFDELLKSDILSQQNKQMRIDIQIQNLDRN